MWRGFHYWFGDSVHAHFDVSALPPDVAARIEQRTRTGTFPTAAAVGRFRVAEDERAVSKGYRVGERHDTVRVVATTPFAMLEDVRLRFSGTTGVDCEVRFPKLRARMLALATLGVLLASALAVVLVLLHVPLLVALLAGGLLAAQAAIYCVAPLWAAQSSALPAVERAVRSLGDEHVRVAMPARVAVGEEVSAEHDDDESAVESRVG